MLRFTPQQAAAIRCRDVSVALSAGAGCGKTFVLTQRFLSHLEPGPQQSSLHGLVAITFTDRAAREMRDRIRDACHARLADCPPNEVDHWSKILRGLDAARISTIHSFCTGLLRSHAVEAGIDPRFTVLEPPLADTMLQETAADVVHRRLIDDDAGVSAFVLRFGLQKTRDLAARLAKQRFRMDWSQWDSVTAEELASRWQATWHEKFVPMLVRQFRTSATADTVRELLAAHVPTHEVMAQRCGEIWSRLDPQFQWRDVIQELTALKDAARVHGGGGKSAWESEDVYVAVQEALADLRKEVEKIRDVLDVSSGDVSLATNLAVHGVRLAREVAQAYAESKHAAGALDFDDLLLLAHELLQTCEDVRRRFAEGIQLLLVDEFQDTDPIQANIVRFLCGEALTRGRLFLVGDFKQSIYRFRRADPTVFQSLRDEIAKEGQLSLTENFRSQPEILSFVNLLFRPEFPEYEPLTAHNAQQLSPLPCIEFLWATRDDQEQLRSGDPSAAESNQDQHVSVEALREREADWIARRISELLSDGIRRIRPKEGANSQADLRPVQLGDIAILFRALTNVAVYEAALRNYGLDYYLVGGKAFYAQQEVYDLLNLCRCLDDPSDAVALVGVLRSPLFGLTDDAIHALRPADGDWWGRLQHPPPAALPGPQRERIRFAAHVLSDLRQEKDRRPIAELLGDAVARTGYDAALLAEHLGRRKVANLRKLIDEAATFDRAELFTLKDFVQRLQTSVFEQTDEEFATTLPEAGNVIRLMSIHQAKGLEFPVVIVADLDRRNNKTLSGAYLHEDWGALIRIPDEFGTKRENLGLTMLGIQEKEADEEESKRLFYVATTRAKDHLILSAGMEPGLKPSSTWMKLLAERFALDTGHPRGDPLLGTMAGAKGRDEIPKICVPHEPPRATPVAGIRAHRPLSELAAALANAAPEPLPPSAARFVADAAAPRAWNVSQLERLAAEIFPELRGGHGSGEDAAVAEALGTLIHGVLEHLDFAVPDSWERRLAAAIESLPKPMESQQIEVARGILQKLRGSDIARRIAAARQVWREFDFVLPWPVGRRNAEPDLITGQVDCCFVAAEETWHLVDFKTGDYSQTASDVDILAPYRLQLGLYALAAEQWWSRPLDTVELVIFRPEVRCIRWTFDSAARTQLQTWVDRVIAGGGVA